MNSINLTVDLGSLAFWSGVPPFVFLVQYANQVWKRRIPADGFASFTMWSAMDVLLVVNSVRSGQSVWLPLGFLAGALSVTCVQWRRGDWTWTWKETLAAVCAGLATGCSFLLHGPASLLVSVLAMTIAGVPVLRAFWKAPAPDSFNLWFFTVIGCVMKYYGEERTDVSWILPLCSGIYNGVMAYVVIRTPRAARVDTEALAAIPVAS